MNTLDSWVSECLLIARTPASFYAGSRKIIRPCSFTMPVLDKSLSLADSGFTNSKLTMLRKSYHHIESQRVAVELWEKRRGQGNYGSVGFTCYNHFVKGDISGATPRGSKFGPCIQSVVITHLNKKQYSLDVFYRTTELFKKFSPDLILIRDILLPPFDFSGMQCTGVHFNFANLTAHPMYFCTLFPHMQYPILELEKLKKRDKYFYNWCVKWSARYLIAEYHHGIAKFAQALRVQKDVNERISKANKRLLQKYLKTNHPGYTRTRFDHEEEE